MIGYRNALAIVELIIYAPCFVLATWIASRQGLAGWRFLMIFCAMRIVGSACQLATINHFSMGLAITAIILNSIGLGLLVLVCVGLLTRANQSLSRPVQRQIFSALGSVALAATVLCIVGGVSSGDSQDPDHTDNRTKAGVIVFAVTWCGLCLLLGLVSWHVFQSANTPTKEQRSLVITVALCTPLILIRIVYTLLSCFSKNTRFNMYTGNQTVRLVMALLEEFAVVIIFLIRGLALPVTQHHGQQQHEEQSHGLHRVPHAQSMMKESANSSVEGNVHGLVQPNVEAPKEQQSKG